MIDISVIVVFRNEEDYIIDCIQSIESQFEQNELNWELILVDGDSQDKSTELAREYLKSKSYPNQIIYNPKKTLAPGWNIGIKAAKGSFVIRPDAHSKLHTGYIEKGIKTLNLKEDVTAVGGVLETKAKGFWGNIIKVALSSRVGVGNSGFRTAKQSGYSDTAVYAVYRKEIFDKVGYFNEELVRHQDNDMHNRIKKAGGKFYMNVEMKADYYARDSVKKAPPSNVFNRILFTRCYGSWCSWIATFDPFCFLYAVAFGHIPLILALFVFSAGSFTVLPLYDGYKLG
jgi:glycosyltransferase involved in cell wall biosynthesis